MPLNADFDYSGDVRYSTGENFTPNSRVMRFDCTRCGEDASYLSYRCTTCGRDLTGDS